MATVRKPKAEKPRDDPKQVSEMMRQRAQCIQQAQMRSFLFASEREGEVMISAMHHLFTFRFHKADERYRPVRDALGYCQALPGYGFGRERGNPATPGVIYCTERPQLGHDPRTTEVQKPALWTNWDAWEALEGFPVRVGTMAAFIPPPHYAPYLEPISHRLEGATAPVYLNAGLLKLAVVDQRQLQAQYRLISLPQITPPLVRVQRNTVIMGFDGPLMTWETIAYLAVTPPGTSLEDEWKRLLPPKTTAEGVFIILRSLVLEVEDAGVEIRPGSFFATAMDDAERVLAAFRASNPLYRGEKAVTAPSSVEDLINARLEATATAITAMTRPAADAAEEEPDEEDEALPDELEEDGDEYGLSDEEAVLADGDAELDEEDV